MAKAAGFKSKLYLHIQLDVGDEQAFLKTTPDSNKVTVLGIPMPSLRRRAFYFPELSFIKR